VINVKREKEEEDFLTQRAPRNTKEKSIFALANLQFNKKTGLYPAPF
jgi:hypothetical protein